MRVYGIEIGLHEDLNAETIRNMSQEDLQKIIDEDLSGEVYTIEAYFDYLNNDQIDTENYWWVVIK